MAYGIDPHFHFHVSGIPETWEYGLIRSENVRLCQHRSAGQVHYHQPWPISNQEWKHAENTRVEPKRDGCGTAEGLRRDRGNDGAGRQRTIGRLCVFAGPLAGSQRIECASLDCSLTPAQVRIVSLMTARHWSTAYPWSAQAAMALAAGVDRAVIEAINAREQPKFTDSVDEMVHAVARELLATGSLGDDIFKAAESTLGYQRLADVVGVIGHFSTTAMMANVVGAEPPTDAPSYLKR